MKSFSLLHVFFLRNVAYLLVFKLNSINITEHSCYARVALHTETYIAETIKHSLDNRLSLDCDFSLIVG